MFERSFSFKPLKTIFWMLFLEIKNGLLNFHKNAGKQAMWKAMKSRTTKVRMKKGLGWIPWDLGAGVKYTKIYLLWNNNAMCPWFFHYLYSHSFHISFMFLTSHYSSFSHFWILLDFDYRIFSKNYMVDIDTNRRFPLFLGKSLLLSFLDTNLWPSFNCADCLYPCLPSLYPLSSWPEHCSCLIYIIQQMFREAELWTQLFPAVNRNELHCVFLGNFNCAFIQIPSRMFSSQKKFTSFLYYPRLTKRYVIHKLSKNFYLSLLILALQSSHFMLCTPSFNAISRSELKNLNLAGCKLQRNCVLQKVRRCILFNLVTA